MPNKQTEHLIEEALKRFDDIFTNRLLTVEHENKDWQDGYNTMVESTRLWMLEAKQNLEKELESIATKSAERSDMKHLFPVDGKYECWRENDKVFCFNLDNFRIGTEISTKEAGQLLGVTDRHIRRLIKEGKIKAVRRDEKEWKVIKEALSKPKE